MKRGFFDVFYRQNPSGSGYAIYCGGLEQMIDYINNLRFLKKIYNIWKLLEHFTVIFLIT